MSPADPRPVIAAVRDGRGLDAAGAALVARGLADGSVSDAQAAAFAMAVLLRGLDEVGRVALTRAMRDSGHVLAWDLPGPVVDKHSTGGIGDTVSLILAPLVASCGAYVPMISGRGLGHTGGTLDKLEAIPGFRTALPEAEFRRVVAGVGCAIVAAGPDLAPADARLYAIRDESATVGSIDLITASILSKKLAAGLDALVLDVKQGSGAFLRGPDAALGLARALVDAAKGAGCRTRAYVTDMDQPLARAAGNALELREAIAVLTGGQGALRDLSLALSSACLDLGACPMAPCRRWTAAPRPNVSPAWSRRREGPPTCWSIPTATCPPRRWCAPCPAMAASPPSTPRRWVMPWWRWAAGGCMPATGSTRGWGLRRCFASARRRAKGARWRWSMPPPRRRPRRRSPPSRPPISWVMAPSPAR